MKLILASSSKFKIDTFNKVGLKHISVDSKFEEDKLLKERVKNKNKDPYEYVKYLAEGKAKSALEKIQKEIENKKENKSKKENKNEKSIQDLDDAIIIGLDTIVYSNGKILEKPKDVEEEKNNLKMSSENINRVITGIYLINLKTNEEIKDFQETKVHFKKIADEDIDYYINNEKDAKYASGYIMETYVSNFLEKIDGSFYNVLGSPVEKIYTHLNNWGIHLKDLD